jgi:hypothetical protein
LKAKICAFALFALFLSAALPVQAAVINFDEFTSPPVTCCFGDSGVTGPLVYPEVTIADAVNSGFVMNGTGWNNMQTSGENLFGTLSGSMSFVFNAPVSNLSFDLINGTGAFDFTVNYYDQSSALILQTVVALSDYATQGSVGTLSPALSGIMSVQILGNGDFAVDTISFNGGEVPEPSSLALAGSALAALALSRLRRRG